MNLLHALFTRNLLMSGVAIVRYVPRAFRVKQVDGNLFFTEEKRQEYRRRVESVTPLSPRQWGTMEVDQMLHHLNLACGGSLGFYNLPNESYLTSRTFFKWIIVDWFPEQPVGLRLPKGFKIPHDAEFDFDFEKQQLLKIVDAAWHARPPNDCWAAPDVRKNDLVRMGKASSNPYRLPPEAIRGLVQHFIESRRHALTAQGFNTSQ